MGNYQSQRELAETTHTYESKIAELQKKLEDENARSKASEEQLRQMKRVISDRQVLSQVRLILDFLNWIPVSMKLSALCFS